MAHPLIPDGVVDVAEQQRRDEQRWRKVAVAFAVFAVITGVIANATAPAGFSVAFATLVVSAVAAFLRPPVGLHLIVFFSLVGDTATSPWWPFTKNMSSRESMFFVSDGLSFTPLEVMLVVTSVAVLLRALSDPTWRFRRGRLLLPLTAFSALVAFGFARGFLSGGDRTIALFEVRPLVYLPTLYVLFTNLFTSRRQYRLTFALAAVAIALQSVFALSYWRGLAPEQRELLETLTEHTASLANDLVILFFLGLIAFRGTRWKKWALVPLLVPIVWTYILSQRRAGMIALFIGLMVLFAVVFLRDRRLFWRITPPIVLAAILLVAATWNASGAIGLPATAVKTALFPGQLDEADQRSNFYRELEAYNLWFTIRVNRLFGVGFGHPFLVVRPMPDISFFAYWQYLPHNSVLWIWLKTGFLGFVTMLYMIARAIQHGARSAMRTVRSDDTAMIVAALGYVLMFIVFAYVDIAWDIRPSILLALMFALCADFVDLPDDPPRPVPPPVRSLVAS